MTCLAQCGRNVALYAHAYFELRPKSIDLHRSAMYSIMQSGEKWRQADGAHASRGLEKAAEYEYTMKYLDDLSPTPAHMPTLALLTRVLKMAAVVGSKVASPGRCPQCSLENSLNLTLDPASFLVNSRD